MGASYQNQGGITCEPLDQRKKRLPEDGQIVLAVGKCGGMGVVRFNYCDGLFSYWKHIANSHCMNPTHWMPLPEPPKEET